jgi:hypothetical protein
MTNLEIIKYLANNNSARLAELLDDIYCCAWNCGSYAGSSGEGKLLEECEIDDFNKWLYQDASKSGFYADEELSEWSKFIGRETYSASVSKGVKNGKPSYFYAINEYYGCVSAGTFGWKNTPTDAIDAVCMELQRIKINEENK